MDIRTFLAHAVKLELDAEEVYMKLVDLAKASGDSDAGTFFQEMVGFSRLHRETAMKRAGFNSMDDIPNGLAGLASWPGNRSESPTLENMGKSLDLAGAMSLALEAEKNGVDFYEQTSQSTTDPEVKALAGEFAEEERSHVLALERFMGLKPY